MIGVLSGCAQQQAAAPQAAAVETPEPPPPPAARPRHPVPRPARKPPLPGEAAPPGETAAAEPPQAEARLTPPQVGELIGLDQRGAARLFGDASERAEHAPATVWRYKTANCELDLFFYLDLRSGEMRTLHYAFKGDAGDAARRQECLRAIVDQGRHSRKSANAPSFSG